eukprot:COSAG01_NODE_20723_length_938_cov_1.499404_1_plen_161_part_00
MLAAATPQVCGGFCDDEAAEVYVLADGHGGHEVAEYVACHAAPTLAECLLALAPARARAAAAAGGGVAYEAATVQQAMRAAFHRLNTFIPPRRGKRALGDGRGRQAGGAGSQLWLHGGGGYGPGACQSHPPCGGGGRGGAAARGQRRRHACRAVPPRALS